MHSARDRDIGSGASRSSFERNRALILAAAVHAAALAIVSLPFGSAASVVKVPNLVSFDSPMPGPPVEATPKPKQPKVVPPQPKVPIAVPPPLVEIVTPRVVALLDQADAQAATGGCDLTAPVQAALQANPEVRAMLSTIPAERRSVANAIAVWNQTWVEPDQQIRQAVLDVVRTTVATTIAAASQACRSQMQRGPRLIYLPGTGDAAGQTTVLALGSGAWTWQQIADTAQPEVPMFADQESAGRPELGSQKPLMIGASFQR